MRLTEDQSRNIAALTSNIPGLNRITSPSGETFVFTLVKADDFNIESTTRLVHVVVCEDTFLYGEAYPVDSRKKGLIQSRDRMEHIIEAWQN